MSLIESKLTAASAAQTKSKKNKRGLRIEQGFYLNLDNVCIWTQHPEHIQFQMTDQNIINIYLKDSDSSKYTSESNVNISEFKRIERELTEYMEL